MFVLKNYLILNNIIFKKLYKMSEEKKSRRRKSLKNTLKTISEIKKSVPKIIFKTQKLVVTLKNKNQLDRWIELY